MSYLINVFKNVIILLLLLTVTIAENNSGVSQTTAKLTSVVTTPTVAVYTTQLPTQNVTIINSLCETLLCNCPATPNEENGIISINCDSRMLKSMPQWNTPVDPNFNNLLSISFKNNHINKIDAFNTTDSIDSISFRGNLIDEIDEYAFQNLSKLKSLSLAENKLDKIDHRIFRTAIDKNLPLEVLDLSDNIIVHIDDDAFEQLENLKELILSYNPIHALDISTIVSLNSIHTLENIQLRHTQLKDLPVNELINPMRNLRELDLSYNLFTSVPETLQSAVQLKKLNFDGNPIMELTVLSFIGLINLEELDINDMSSLSTIYQGTFTPMTKLVKLSCSNNTKLNKIATQSFIDHHGEGPKNLKSLRLNNNSLVTINQETFLHMSEVKMEFNDNKLHCSCYLKWMKSKYGELRCNTPSSVKGKQLKEVDFDKVPCETNEAIKTSHIGMALGISIVVIALVGSLIFIILRRRDTKGYPNAHYSRAKINDGCDFNEDGDL